MPNSFYPCTITFSKLDAIGSFLDERTGLCQQALLSVPGFNKRLSLKPWEENEERPERSRLTNSFIGHFTKGFVVYQRNTCCSLPWGRRGGAPGQYRSMCLDGWAALSAHPERADHRQTPFPCRRLPSPLPLGTSPPLAEMPTFPKSGPQAQSSLFPGL